MLYSLLLLLGNDDDDDDGFKATSAITKNASMTDPKRNFFFFSSWLIDDDTFAITSGIQWREAFLYNFGATELPEGDGALAAFDRVYNEINDNLM